MPSSRPLSGLRVLVIGTGPYLFYAQHRPVIGTDPLHPFDRTQAMSSRTGHGDSLFVTHPEMQGDFEAAGAYLAPTGCADIGLLRFDAAEYQMWSVLQEAAPYDLDIQHVGVVNDTARLAHAPPFSTFVPCAVVSLKFYAGDPVIITVNGIDYRRVWDATQVAIYHPAR